MHNADYGVMAAAAAMHRVCRMLEERDEGERMVEVRTQKAV